MENGYKEITDRAEFARLIKNNGELLVFSFATDCKTDELVCCRTPVPAAKAAKMLTEGAYDNFAWRIAGDGSAQTGYEAASLSLRLQRKAECLQRDVARWEEAIAVQHAYRHRGVLPDSDHLARLQQWLAKAQADLADIRSRLAAITATQPAAA
ncbi:hypothetical protein OpiT1DRAFT_03995 [Opitutaceae bacterium TAV1]|nr:hypothetical protein OpiT1DRAFT_03995 [Opitutaceae bacterium TAV1]